jgi:hypothetical protein
MGGGEAVSMIMFYHIPQEGEYQFVHCSNAASAMPTCRTIGYCRFYRQK